MLTKICPVPETQGPQNGINSVSVHLLVTYPPHIYLATPPFCTAIAYFQDKFWVILIRVECLEQAINLGGDWRSQATAPGHREGVGILGRPLRHTDQQGRL